MIMPCGSDCRGSAHLAREAVHAVAWIQDHSKDHSILQSHDSGGLMLADHGRDTGPQPNDSILPSHGSAGLMVACRGRDTYSGVLRKGDIMCC